MARATLESGMAHIVGFERDQLLLLRAAGDDYVEADNPLRFIDAFVDGWPLQRRGLRASKPRRRAGPAARRGALRSVRRPMRPKRPQFPATRSSVTARARCGPRGSFGDQGHPPEDDSRGGDSAADFVNPTSRGNAVTEYWFQPRIESARYVRPRSADDCFTSTPDRLLRANSGRCWTAWRTRQIDPERPFEIRPVNGWEGRGSGRF